MTIQVNDKAYELEMLTYLKVFYPLEEIGINNDIEQPLFKIDITSSDIMVAYFDGHNKIVKWGRTNEMIRLYNLEEGKAKRSLGKAIAKSLIYDICVEVTCVRPKWGILMGIRPTKLVFRLFEELGNEDLVINRLTDFYRLDINKAMLLCGVVREEQPYLRQTGDKHSIYIGIPFCPTRCSYCTFTSYAAEKFKDAYDAYVDVLIKELEAFEGMFSNIRSIYIGGGTPTSLTESDFDRLLKCARRLIGSMDIEFTVEAGRVDTITSNKLQSMKKYGVNRISINPQTLNDQTLLTIERNHTALDVIATYNEVRSLDFAQINMDIILGLPGETTVDVKVTLDQVIALRPENITVHTLALKRGSALSANKDLYLSEMNANISDMLEVAQKKLFEAGYIGYYLYRQKNMVGNYENVGYCLTGKGSIYNIHTMEEKESIIAFGAGAITKWIKNKKLIRFDQPKDVRTYIKKINDIIAKKKKFLEL